MKYKLRFEHSLKLRYYLVYITQDLFGEWILLKSWGGINQTGGVVLSTPCASYAEAMSKIESIKKARARQGYALVA